ncbi:uncharacterized protein A4U43_C09F6180 [Asparagus officinalis]|uniref:Protein kinase domain-containing protein n=1 Tax=Asparagus officinalis TaxID=4686 RepID=A0A5P1E669_ASPOF|nr:cyclin-dependent kinase G-2-like [Asparagus officinalis]XP_020245513.1 cyclin-dependent kinase G-2-like [Asparagus officinalis]XP_020245515.1 cyclin-dependent kinase G-2-like [Asparagus officinalis]XP_020245516.1 cyclin-dependent kinase G-2-like [Asparagus officinalis]XP_020245517.1 cyclin-dependent kinase G-2-like [Asparagus officinalis]XP_020245518.1 cyclin-dependent kinase G-2-like [Asparagus officinalis]XP_020245519.1 cyclin-dependent kinase G-2-like [Asparagus officinalis]XP_02024552
MAAGRYRGYRDHEYRARDFDLEISGRKDRYHDRNGDRYRNHGKIHHDRAKDWHRDAKERELINGSHGVKRSVEREPGELSSGSDDEGVDSGQNGILVNGKRKISPIVWDNDNDGKTKGKMESRNEPPNSVEFHGPSDSPQVCEKMEEDEELPPARNISFSRWVNGNDEETEDVDEVFVPKRRKTASPLDATPELGEVISREGSGGSTSMRSSSSGDFVDVSDGKYDINGSEGLLETDSEAEDYRDQTLEPGSAPQRSFNMLQGCRNVDEFERLNRIDEGTYGVVFRARDKKTGEVMALKKVKLEKEREGFPLTALREINILLSFHHPSIVDVKEVVMGDLNSVFMVMEYMEHDLKGLMESMKQPFSQSEVKCLMLQLLSGVNYLHDNWVLHRDLKTSNILMNNRGELKICDFGLARQYGSPLKPYTQLVVTLWYRAPELLLGEKEYSTAIDMWSLGCIMAELLAKEPLFPGKTEVDQLDKIFRTLGTPTEKIWPGFAKLPGVKANFVKQPYNKLREKFPPTSFTGRPTLSEAGFDLLNRLLTYNPEKRITAEDALNHAWFREVPLPKSKDFMPTFPAQHAQDRRLRRTMKSPDPLEELRRKEGGVGNGGLFG